VTIVIGTLACIGAGFVLVFGTWVVINLIAIGLYINAQNRLMGRPTLWGRARNKLKGHR
jgi:hypothetical protein